MLEGWIGIMQHFGQAGSGFTGGSRTMSFVVLYAHILCFFFILFSVS